MYSSTMSCNIPPSHLASEEHPRVGGIGVEAAMTREFRGMEAHPPMAQPTREGTRIVAVPGERGRAE